MNRAISFFEACSTSSLDGLGENCEATYSDNVFFIIKCWKICEEMDREQSEIPFLDNQLFLAFVSACLALLTLVIYPQVVTKISQIAENLSNPSHR